MRKLLDVEGRPGLVKDISTGFVHNTNISDEVARIRAKKKERLESINEMNSLKTNVKNLQNDIGDIKTMLNQILEKL